MNSFNDEEKALSMLLFSNRRNVVMLFKRFLETVEQIGDCHIDTINKLKQNLPSEYHRYVDLSEYLTPAREEAIRKLILDAGNECIRNTENDIKQFKVTFK